MPSRPPEQPTEAADAAAPGQDDAGPGTAAAATGAPSRTPALWWGAGAVVVAVVAGALGAFGAFGRPTAEAAATVSGRAVAVSARDCPGGGEVRTFTRDDRVLVVARAEGGWLGVRDPADVTRVVWVPAASLRSDDGQPALDSLPVRSCADEASTGVAAAAPTPGAPEPAPGAPAPAPLPGAPDTTAPTLPGAPGGADPAVGPGGGATPSTAPAQPPAGGQTPGSTTTSSTTAVPDTQRPALGNTSATPTQLCDVVQQGWATTANVTAFVTDNVGVTSVTATWSGLPGSGVQLTRAAGSTWTGTVGPFSGAVPPNQSVNLTITLTARDAAGNTATTTTGPVRVFDGGLCLF